MACSKVYTAGTLASLLVLIALTGAYLLSYWYMGPLCNSDGSSCVPVHAGIFVSCITSPAGFGGDCSPVEATAIFRNRRVETLVVRIAGGLACLASLIPIATHATLACAKLRGGRRSAVQKATKWRMRIISWVGAVIVLVSGAITVSVMAEVLPPGGDHVGWCFWLVISAWLATAVSAALIDRKMTLSAVKDAAAMMTFNAPPGGYPDLIPGGNTPAHGYDMRALDDGAAAPVRDYRGVRGASYASDSELAVTSLPSTPPNATAGGTGVHSDDEECVMPTLGDLHADPLGGALRGHRVDSPPHGADAHLLPVGKRPGEGVNDAVRVAPSPRIAPSRGAPQPPSPIASVLPGASTVAPSPMPAPPVTAARRGASLGSPAGGRTASRRSSGQVDAMHERTESTSSDVEVDVDLDLSVSLSDAEAFALGRIHHTSSRRIHASPAAAAAAGAAGTGVSTTATSSSAASAVTASSRGEAVDLTAPRSPPGRPGSLPSSAATTATTASFHARPMLAAAKPAAPPPVIASILDEDGPIGATRSSSSSNMFATTRQQRSTTQDALTLSGGISIDASPVDAASAAAARPMPASLSLVAGLTSGTDSLGRLLSASPSDGGPGSARGPGTAYSSVRAAGASRRSLLGMPSVFDNTRRLSGAHASGAPDVGAAKDGNKRSSLRDAIRSATTVQEVVDDDF